MEKILESISNGAVNVFWLSFFISIGRAAMHVLLLYIGNCVIMPVF
jgi:hypothetical protein